MAANQLGHRRPRGYLAVAVVTSAFACGSASLAECLRYEVTAIVESPCVPQGANAVQGLAINEQQDIAGYYFCLAGNEHAFVSWGGGALDQLNMAGEALSQAAAINDLGAIVGFMEDAITRHGFVYQDGTARLLGTLPNGTFSEAEGINNAGVVCGIAGNNITGPNRAFIWTGEGPIVDLDLPRGPNNAAADINEAGQIVGWMGTVPGGTFYAEAFIWQDGETTPLGVPAPGLSSRAYAVNQRGDVCGAYFWPQPGGGLSNSRACVWSAGEVIELGACAGYTRTIALDLNDDLTVVGYCEALGEPSFAVLWRDGEMHAILDLLAPNSGVIALKPFVAINQAGQIVANAVLTSGASPAVILTPVPPRDGDTDCDWIVDVDDLINVIVSWGALVAQSGSGSPDVDGDGVVGVDDLVMVLVNWG